MFKNKKEFIHDFKERLIETYGTTAEYTHPTERYMVLGDMVRDYASINWKECKTQQAFGQTKRVYYFSMEFLLGRSLRNNMMNLGIYDMVQQGLEEIGISLDEVMDVEADPGLGNGGLGRLAACFMDSSATLNYAVNGNCIRYEYGLFRQRINANGEQEELPDIWLRNGNPWEMRKPKLGVDISFWGHVLVNGDEQGNLHFNTVDDVKVRAVPYDMPMIGYQTPMTNTLRLWSAEPADEVPNGVDYRQYLSDVAAICRNVYPDDSTEDGKYLRLKQQYFFVAAGLHTIIRDHMIDHGTLDTLPDYVTIQLNDTHPVLAIPEMMRVLMDTYGYSWAKAWDITGRVMAYTNHTILQEALEVWPCRYVEKLLPRIYMIIEEIDRQFTSQIREQFHDEELVRRTRIIDGNMIHMARLAVVGSYSVNGVAELHTQILKNSLFSDYDRIYPGKINNKTNGITPRRWLLNSNRELCEFLDQTIGTDYRSNTSKLQKLKEHIDDPEIQDRFLAVKYTRKELLAAYILKETGIEVDPNSIFDVQAKRLHAYKRQLLDILHVIDLYQRMKADPNFRIYPHTFIFAAKAASSYTFAKKVIQLINNVASKVNNDPETNGYLKVVFLPNYCVTMAEVLIGGADVSEQISMAGKEASGTGNMKFMMNGALTLGTLDGANVEIDRLVSREHDVIFGLTVDQIPDYVRNYSAWDLYTNHPRLRMIIDSLLDGTWNADRDCFRVIYDELFRKNDEYLVLADFDSYTLAQEEIERRYADRRGWAKSCLVNIAESGYFSSDRTINQYAEEIWHIEPLHMKEKKA